MARSGQPGSVPSTSSRDLMQRQAQFVLRCATANSHYDQTRISKPRRYRRTSSFPSRCSQQPRMYRRTPCENEMMHMHYDPMNVALPSRLLLPGELCEFKVHGYCRQAITFAIRRDLGLWICEGRTCQQREAHGCNQSLHFLPTLDTGAPLRTLMAMVRWSRPCRVRKPSGTSRKYPKVSGRPRPKAPAGSEAVIGWCSQSGRSRFNV